MFTPLMIALLDAVTACWEAGGLAVADVGSNKV
jgi:hypothetical protein